MVNILALDVATKTGWAHSHGESGVWDFKVRIDESADMRLIRLRQKLKLIQHSLGIDLVVFEAAMHSSKGKKTQARALVVQGELQGVVKSFCTQAGIPYRGFSSAEIKSHATGGGRANKKEMVDLAWAKWPDVRIEDDNQADALWLLDLAMERVEDLSI